MNNKSKTGSSGSISAPSSLGLGSGASGSVMFSRIGFLVVVACLLIFGLVMLYSASSIYSYNQSGNYTTIFYKQTLFVAAGIIVALIVAVIPYNKLGLGVCALALAVCIPLLALVLVEGDDALGARRWIDLGFTTLQPSEFAKIALMLVLAQLVNRCRTDGYSIALIILMIISCVIPIGLIIVEPDLGTTIIAVVGILAVLWFGGIPKRIVGLLTFCFFIVACFAVLGSGFRQNRISSWLDPWSDPQVSGYQLLNSYYAFGGGGITGVGLGLSKQKFNWLPQSENDFLFAIVGEELGLIGAFVVVLLFLALVIFTLNIARSSSDTFGAMVAGSAGVIIGAQAFLNMLCVVGALPTTGKPLPFFSAGGSSIFSTMILVGLILSVSIRSSEANVYDFRREQFTVVEGGKTGGSSLSGVGSVLSYLPNPAAIVGSMLSRPAHAQKPAQPERVPARRQRRTGSSTGTSRSAGPEPNTSRRYNPQPRVEATINKEAGNSRRERINLEKVVPISRGKAEQSTRESERRQKKRRAASSRSASTPEPARRQTAAPLSMQSLRLHRVRKTGTGDN